MISAKADLLMETLTNLKTDKITPFFKMVRESEEAMPTDGRLSHLLRVNFAKYTNQTKTTIEYDSTNLPDEIWRKKFTIAVSRVIDGSVTPEEAKEALGINKD